MIVRNLKSLARTDRRVKSHSSKSTRFLLADDGMGYSLNLTEIEAGLEIEMRYDHHFETVYCISGTVSIEAQTPYIALVFGTALWLFGVNTAAYIVEFVRGHNHRHHLV